MKRPHVLVAAIVLGLLDACGAAERQANQAAMPRATAFVVPVQAPDSTVLAEGAGFTVGQVTVTVTSRGQELWSASGGGERVYERPRLYGGSKVTILELLPSAVRVRTEEGVEGWLREAAATALTAEPGVAGDHARFHPGRRVQIVWPRGIPLRAAPQSDAPKIREKLAAGKQATVEQVLGDWLKVTLDDGTSGWARWFYDGAIYVDTTP